MSWVTSTAVCFKRCENFLQIFLQRRPDEWIERAERLVEQEHFRRKHERAHQADALALSAGKLGGITIECFAREPRQSAKFVEPRFHLGSRAAEMARHEKNVGAGGEMRKEPALLDDVADAAAHLLGARLASTSQVIKYDLAAVGLEEGDDQTQESRFSATARTDQRSR